jgi:hypothetical protein
MHAGVKIALGLVGFAGALALLGKSPGDELVVGDVALVPVTKIPLDKVPADVRADVSDLQTSPDASTTSIGIRVDSITGDSFAGPGVGAFRPDGSAVVETVPGAIALKRDLVVGILKRGTTPAASGNTLEKGSFV